MVQPLSKGSVDVCRELSLMNQDRHAGVLHRRPPASISFEFGLTEWTATVAELAIGRNARSVEGAWRASGTDVTRMAEPVSIKAAWRTLFSSHIIEVSQDDEDAIRILAVDWGDRESSVEGKGG